MLLLRVSCLEAWDLLSLGRMLLSGIYIYLST